MSKKLLIVLVSLLALFVMSSTNTAVYAQQGRSVRFLATGDPQYENDPGASTERTEKRKLTNETMAEIASKLRSSRYRGLIIAGDLTQNTRVDEYWAYEASISSVSNKIYDGLGNHDMESRGIVEIECHIVGCITPQYIRSEVWGRTRSTASNYSRNSSSAEPHYSWDWDDVHFVQLNLYPGDNHHAQVHDHLQPMNSLTFLRDDLRSRVGSSGRPVVLVHHYGMDYFSRGSDRCSDTDHNGSGAWWTKANRDAYWDTIAHYNVVAIITGHLHRGSSCGDWWYTDWQRPTGKNNGPRSIPNFVAGGAVTGFYTEFEIQNNQIIAKRFDSTKSGATDTITVDFPEYHYLNAYPTLTGDVNGDGKTDLIFMGQGWSGRGLNIRTKLSNDDGTWDSKEQVLGDGKGVHTYPTLTGDVNGDGKTDLIFIGQGWNGTGLNIRTKLSNGDGTWTSKSQVLGDGSGIHTQSALVGDVNGDGKTDLIFAFQHWNGRGLQIRTKLSNGDGTWTSKSQVLGDGSGIHTQNALVGDVNGDGKTDLIFAFQHWNGRGLQIRTKLSNGNGTWTSKSQQLGDGPGIHAQPTLTGDVNGDGKTDLIFAFQHWNGRGLQIRTKLSNGNGTWTSKSQQFGDGSGIHVYPTLTGDVNIGQRYTDLIFVGQGWSGRGLNIRTKLPYSNGTWRSRSQVLGDGSDVHTYPTLTGDVNGDGRTDLIFIGYDWSGAGLNIRTKLSNGNGTWNPKADVLES